jgi:ligand-binding sensor domain-containing protein
MDHSDVVDGNGSLMWIHALTADKQGRIWVCHGFATKRMAFLAGDQWRDANELRPSNITSLGRTLIAGPKGRIWFVSPEGLIGYDGRRWAGPFRAPELMVRTYNRFKLIYSDKDRAHLADIQERMHKRYGEEEPPPTPWTSEVYSGIQDRDGDIWLGATRGIWRFEERTGCWKVYPTHGLAEEVSLIFEDRYGRIWFSDSDAHLALYDKRKDAWTTYDLAFEDAVVEAVYVDKQGKVMIGTELGIIILDERTREMKPLAVNLRGNLVHGISAISTDNQERIWIGTSEAILVLKR